MNISKLAIVVGVGRGGIGDHLAMKFSKEGYRVAMVARSSLAHLESKIPNSKSYQCDAGDPDQVKATVEAIQKDLGKGDETTVHALFYNVGGGVFKTFSETTYEELQQGWRMGPAGLFLWTQKCLPLMKDGESCIGVTGATASWRGMPVTPAFASTKMGTRGLAQALARDFGPNRGIHVFHVIIDGVVRVDPDGEDPMGQKRPANELLHPADIADVYWQLSQQPRTCWTQETHVAAQGAFGSIASI